MTTGKRRLVIAVSAALLAAVAIVLLLPLLDHRPQFAFLGDHKPIRRIRYAASAPGVPAWIVTTYAFEGDWNRVRIEAVKDAKRAGLHNERSFEGRYITLSNGDITDPSNWVRRTELSLSKDTSDVQSSGPSASIYEKKGWIYIEISEPEIGYLDRLLRFLGL